MTDSERYIPLPIQRQLRQESGFGCCVCGNPVFEYHHIVDFAKARAHRPEDMMTLCPNHHYEATVGALTVEEQRQHKAKPSNVAAGYADGLLKVTSLGVAVRIGSNDFVGAGFKFLVDGSPLLTLGSDDRGRLLLTVDVYDASDVLLLAIHENEWISGDPLPWDIEFGHRWLVLRAKHRDISLEVDARHEPLSLKGKLMRHGQVFGMGASQLRFNGVVKGVGVSDLGLVGMQIEADTLARELRLAPHPPFEQGMLVSWPDRVERLVKCFDALKQLEAQSV